MRKVASLLIFLAFSLFLYSVSDAFTAYIYTEPDPSGGGVWPPNQCEENNPANYLHTGKPSSCYYVDYWCGTDGSPLVEQRSLVAGDWGHASAGCPADWGSHEQIGECIYRHAGCTLKGGENGTFFIRLRMFENCKQDLKIYYVNANCTTCPAPIFKYTGSLRGLKCSDQNVTYATVGPGLWCYDANNDGFADHISYENGQISLLSSCGCTDADGDGHYAESDSCALGDDCDDNDNTVHPGAPEVCGDEKDNDCDGEVDEGCCDISAGLTADRTAFSPGAGETVTLTGTISSSEQDNITWILSIAGQSRSGSGPNASLTWDGRTGGGKLAEPGIYTATLEASSEAGCSDSSEIDIVVVPPIDHCPIQIGSGADWANGSLEDSRELFSTKGTGLNTEFTLYYNSLDGYSGPLGMGWTHSYNMRLLEREGDMFSLMEEDGDRILLINKEDHYGPELSAYPALYENPDGTRELLYKDGLRYLFAGAGSLLTIEDRNGNKVLLSYDAGGSLSKITDPGGRETLLNYDFLGRIIAILDPAENQYTFAYSNGYLANVTAPDGSSWSYAYDADAYMLSKTNPNGDITYYEYDSAHRVIKSTDPEGRTKSLSYSPEASRAVLTEADGGNWTYEYNNGTGLLVSKTDPEGGKTIYEYDEYGNTLSRTEADGSRTEYAYDEYDNITSVKDAAGSVTAYTYNEFGQVTSVTDPEGHVRAFEYDESGNLTKTTDPAGAVTTYEYDTKGNIVKIISPSGNAMAISYDEKGNIASVTDYEGNVTGFTYDEMGNMTSQTDSLGNTSYFEYDSAGRLIKSIDAKGNETIYGYDSNGNRISEIDANGNTTYYEYDSKGKLTKTTDALGNVTTFVYGGTGCGSCGGGGDKLTAVIDANGNRTSYKYDFLGRLIEEKDPLGNLISYAYDSKGNLISKTDANGNKINYAYDALGRLLRKESPDGSTEVFEYDSSGNITYAGNKDIAYEFTYNAKGQAVSVSDSNGFALSYEYDVAGNKTKMKSPDGSTVTYIYDSNNRLSAMVPDAGRFEFEYDPSGRRTKLSYPNGTFATYSYDTAGRLTDLAHKMAGGSVIDSFTYTHDNVGNRLAKTTPERTISYGYDKIYQLLEALSTTPGNSSNNNGKGKGTDTATENQKEYYTYGPTGNRTSTHISDFYQHNSANQLLSDSKYQYAYDKNGNLISKTGNGLIMSFIYDYENRLVRVEKIESGSEIKAEYKYDPFGRRIEKKVTENGTAAITRYFYDGEDILFEYDEFGNKENTYVHGLGIDEPLALIDNKSNVYYYHADGLGSVTKMTDAAGKVVQEYEYDSFGNLHDQKNRIKQPYTYTAREWDRETGLYYYRARYYDTEAGRFISKDPIGFAGGDMNLYRYVKNNALNLKDPHGLSDKDLKKMGEEFGRQCVDILIRNKSDRCEENCMQCCTELICMNPALIVGNTLIAHSSCMTVCLTGYGYYYGK